VNRKSEILQKKKKKSTCIQHKHKNTLKKGNASDQSAAARIGSRLKEIHNPNEQAFLPKITEETKRRERKEGGKNESRNILSSGMCGS
jgi:hypothetical protein